MSGATVVARNRYDALHCAALFCLLVGCALLCFSVSAGLRLQPSALCRSAHPPHGQMGHTRTHAHSRACTVRATKRAATTNKEQQTNKHDKQNKESRDCALREKSRRDSFPVIAPIVVRVVGGA